MTSFPGAMSELKKKPEIFMGTAITLLFLVLSLVPGGFPERLELRYYDMRMGLRMAQGGEDDIVLVDIDDRSLQAIGRWPWPRSILADGIRKIDACAAFDCHKRFPVNDFKGARDDAGVHDVPDGRSRML